MKRRSEMSRKLCADSERPVRIQEATGVRYVGKHRPSIPAGRHSAEARAVIARHGAR